MSKSNHFCKKSVFGQLISLIDDSLIKKEVKKCESDRYTKRFKIKDHLISMLFCSFSKWKSGERCEVRVVLSQSSRRIGEMIAFLSTLRNIGDVLASAQVFF